MPQLIRGRTVSSPDCFDAGSDMPVSARLARAQPPHRMSRCAAAGFVAVASRLAMRNAVPHILEPAPAPCVRADVAIVRLAAGWVARPSPGP